jgi:N-acetylneuraminic acid mutarotase
MSRLLPLSLALAVLALAACGEGTTPTQPAGPGDEVPAAPSLAVGSNTWTARAPLPDFSFGISAAVVPNSAGQSIVYALGAHGEENGLGFPVRAYNVATNTWTNTHTIVYVSRTNGIGVIGGKLYFSGGFSDFDGSSCCQIWTLYAYNPVTNQLTRKADMPKATADGVTGVINDKLYVLPGSCSGEFYPSPQGCATREIRTLYRYNPVTNTWATRPLAPHFHKNGAGGVIDGKFYVAGGELLNAPPVTALDVYDPVTNKWSTLAPMPTGGPVIGTVMNHKLFVILRGSPRTTYAYDPATNTWSTKASPALLHEALVRVAVNGRNRLLAVGGQHVTTPGVSGLWTLHDSELYMP